LDAGPVNYEVHFQPEQPLNERILFPGLRPPSATALRTPASFASRNDDGSHIYYATFTAYDGRVVVPELVETPDFLNFRS